MNNILLIARREYLDNIYRKGFWLSVMVFPLTMVLAVMVPAWLSKQEKPLHYSIVDRTGWLLPQLEHKIMRADAEVLLDLVAADTDVSQYLPVPLQPFAKVVPSLDTTDRARLLDELAGDGPARPLPQGLSTADASGFRRFLAALTPEQARKLSRNLSQSRFVLDPIPADDMAGLEGRLKSGGSSAYVLISPSTDGHIDCRFVTDNLLNDDLSAWLQPIVRSAVTDHQVTLAHLPPEIAALLAKPVTFQTQVLTGNGAQDITTAQKIREWTPVALTYLLWFSIFFSSQLLVSQTIEEKSNRIMEVILSAVSPFELLAGKIAGSACTGFTLIGSWLGTLLILGFMSGPVSADAAKAALGVLSAQPELCVTFLVYFLLGYLMYATLLGALGSIASTAREAQNYVQPINAVLIVPILLMGPIARDPNGAAAVITSYIPLLTPFTMMSRVGGHPGILVYLETSALLVASIGAMLWLALRILRFSLLANGKPPGMKEVSRWLRD